MTRVVRSAGAAALLGFLLVGVPLLTWRAAGWPLPDGLPAWDDVSRRIQQGDVPGTTILRTIAVVVWVAWFQMAWALIWELAVNIRRDLAGRPARRAPFVLAPIGDAVAHLVAVVVAIGTIAQPTPAVSLAGSPTTPVEPASVTISIDDPIDGPIDGGAVNARVAPGRTADALQVWRADRYDSLWAIAERALGDGAALEQVLELNPALSAAHTFRNGDVVLLPAHADVPRERRPDLPADGDVSSSESSYRVRRGDGMWDVAAALLGDGTRYSELIEMVIGQEVAPGVVYHSAEQTIHPGWVFRVDRSTPGTGSGSVPVRPGDSLWAIAERELDDPHRWPELWATNRDDVMEDGRIFDDPDLIHPGWTIDLPPESDVPHSEAVEPGADEPAVVGEPPADLHLDRAGPDDDRGLDGDQADDPGAGPEPGRVNVWGSTASATEPQLTTHDLGEGSTEGPAAPGDQPTPPPAAEEHVETVDVDEGDDERIDDVDEGDDAGDDDESGGSVTLLTFDRAAMLSAGILALLGVRRRDRLRRSTPRASVPHQTPRPVATERALRAVDAGERFARVDIAIRAAAVVLVEAGERVHAVMVAADGEVTLVASGPVQLPLPWTGSGSRWVLPAITPLELLAPDARRSGAPCPTLVQLGCTDDDREVYVDLEAIEALEVGGPAHAADSIVASIATTLAASVLAEVTSLVTIGVPDEALLDHRHHVAARDVEHAFDVAAEAVGSTRTQRRSTFELRALGTSAESWEPAVVMIGSWLPAVTPPVDRRALAIVSAAPIAGASCRLSPVGSSESTEWELAPVGLRFNPIGLSETDVAALAELASVPEFPVAPEPALVRAGCDIRGEPRPDEPVDRPWTLLVTSFGAVQVVDADGRAAKFERSKTRELIAWLVTHRRRSTRSSARAALWEIDVRDATFANVVSEARRSMARLVDPPPDAEWIDRTLTDGLPLHEQVWSDGDVIEHALEVARVQPPAQAIATLRPAVELINGIPFAGTSYLWPDAEGITSQLVLLATTATTELAAHCLSIGDVGGVFAATARGLQVLPGHEELVGLRMRAHARAGDHAGVRAEWESYERVLVGDPWSDGEPSPKLVDLRRSLLSP